MDFYGTDLLSVNNLIIDQSGLIDNTPLDEISGRLTTIYPILSFPSGRLRRVLIENTTNSDSGQKFWKYNISIWGEELIHRFDWILGKNYRISNFKLKFSPKSAPPGLFQSFIILTDHSHVCLIDD